MKAALIKSIRTGVFFDRKYWARYSKSEYDLKPIYFSSVIMRDKTRQLGSCTSKLLCGFTETLIIPSGEVLQGS